MRKHIIVLIVVLAAISAASVYGYMTFNEAPKHEDTILKLNESGNLVEVGDIKEYNKIVKKERPKAEATLTKDQIKDAYTKLLKDIYGVDKITLEVSDACKADNGKAVYCVNAVVESDKFIDYVFLIVDGNTLPGNNQNTIYFAYFYHMDKDDSYQAKLSKDDILKLAKEEYAKHKTPASNDTYQVFLYKAPNNKPVYDVDVNNGVMKVSYDGDTGELLELFVEEDETVWSESECRQLAQETLDSNNYNYSDYLSLGDAHEESANNSTNYTYDIVYTNGSDKQVIGSIKIDANKKEVIDFSISDPVVEEEHNDTENTVEETPADYTQETTHRSEPVYEPETTQERNYDSGGSSSNSIGSGSSGSSSSS